MGKSKRHPRNQSLAPTADVYKLPEDIDSYFAEPVCPPSMVRNRDIQQGRKGTCVAVTAQAFLTSVRDRAACIL